MSDTNTVGAIDIGTNAVRFLICEIDETSETKRYRKVAFLRVPVRLGEDVFTIGEVSDKRRDMLCEAMEGFSHLIKAYDVRAYRACATSAMREASNGDDIIAAVREKSGINVEIISGPEEAEIIYEAGVANAGEEEWKNSLHVDVGGGSTEVVIYADGHIVESRSFRLGTVRILKNAVRDEDVALFKSELKEIGERYPGLRIIASGGNINKAQKLLHRRAGEPFTVVELKMLYDSLAGMTFEERIKYFKLNAYRADVIIPALKIFLTVSKLCHAPVFIVPQIGLVDGIISHLDAHLTAK